MNKVKAIWFLPGIPGQPIYEMENGEVRIPYPHNKAGMMIWCNEEEALKAVVSTNIKQDSEHKKFIRKQFVDIRSEIGGMKKKELKAVN